MRLIVSVGADVSAEDRWHSSAFEEAAKYGHDEVMRFLEKKSTDPNSSPMSSSAVGCS